MQKTVTFKVNLTSLYTYTFIHVFRKFYKYCVHLSICVKTYKIIIVNRTLQTEKFNFGHNL